MGIFGGGYDKPGKGVDKNEPKKKGFFLFFLGLTFCFPFFEFFVTHQGSADIG